MEQCYAKLSQLLIAGNIEEIKKLTQQASEEGIPADDLLHKRLLPGMDVHRRSPSLD